MARSVLHQNSSVPNGEWHDSTTCPGWQWKGDTSSDEVAGHMFAYPLIADLVEDEKPAAIELVDTIVGELHCCINKGGLLTHAIGAYYCDCIIKSDLLTHAMEAHSC